MFETRKEFEQKLPERIEKAKENIHKGDIINYRSGFVEILKIDSDQLEVKGAYNLIQTIDWEDVVEYNWQEL